MNADGDKISCECKYGYIGGRCQSCGPGLFGKPDVIGKKFIKERKGGADNNVFCLLQAIIANRVNVLVILIHIIQVLAIP